MPKSYKEVPTVPPEPTTPAWVQKMNQHYAEHRWYRPEDLYRILGNPLAGIGGESIPAESGFAHAKKV